MTGAIAFRRLVRRLAKLKVQSAVIDGEAVHAETDGTFSFHALQNALSTGKLDRLRYYAFDLLHLNGVDLAQQAAAGTQGPASGTASTKAPPEIQYSEHFAETGEKILAHACHLALEGIVSKRADAPYRSGRTDGWLKSKCIKEQELVIGGYTEQPKHPGSLGALLIGYFDNDALRFAGKVGTGFSHQEGRDLLKKLRAIRAERSPFASLPSDARRGAHFVTPTLVAHVNFSEWTPDGKLRHPSFQGLREDKPAREVVREKEKPLGRSRRRRAPAPKPQRRRKPEAQRRATTSSPASPSRILIACSGRKAASPSSTWRATMRRSRRAFSSMPATGR